MATLSDTIDWSTDEALLKKFLRLPAGPHADDDLLEIWLQAATEKGDQFLGREFTADDPPATVPVNCRIGCWAYVKGIRDWNLREAGLIEKKTASLTEKYSSAAGPDSSRAVFDAALRSARPYWDDYCYDVTQPGKL